MSHIIALERAQDADFYVACVARLFLGAHATRHQLQATVDRQEAAYHALEEARQAAFQAAPTKASDE